MDELSNLRNKRLEDEIIAKALELFNYTKSDSFAFPIPGTTPPLYVAIGEKQAIIELMGIMPDE